MAVIEKTDTVFKFQLLLLAATVSAIYVLEPSLTSSLRLFEILGAISASMITVYGVGKMDKVT